MASLWVKHDAGTSSWSACTAFADPDTYKSDRENPRAGRAKKLEQSGRRYIRNK